MAKYRGREVSVEQYPTEDTKVIVRYDGALETVDIRELILSIQELGLFSNRETLKTQRTVDRQTKKRTEEELRNPKNPRPPKEPKPVAQISIGSPQEKEMKIKIKEKRIL
jgi:hypothetical protein